MKFRPILLLVLVPLLVGSASFLATRLLSGGRPRIEVATTIDVGEQISGSTLDLPIVVHNSGSMPLNLHGFWGSCTCVSLLARANGETTCLDRATIAPGDSFEIAAQVRVRNTDPGPFRTLIAFETNDPRRPSVQLEIVGRVKGRLLLFPTELELASYTPAERFCQTIQVYNLGLDHPGEIGEVVGDPAENVVIKEIRRTSDLTTGDDSPLGRLVAEVDLEVVGPAKPGTLESCVKLQVAENDGKVLSLPVRVILRPRVEVTPSVVVLPRVTGAGLSYSAECVCTGRDGELLDLAAVEVPDGMEVVLKEPEGSSNARVMVISWVGHESDPHVSSPRFETLRLFAEGSKFKQPIDIPVTVKAAP